jgi:acetyl esterase/lipase
MPSLIYRYFHPTLDALNPFHPVPLTTRLRLLAFQPLALLSYLFNTIPFRHHRHKTTTISIPTRSGAISCLLYHPTPHQSDPTPPPLHIDIHGGAFIGGLPEANFRFHTHLLATTGALILSPTYRFAPLHPFPAAINDIDSLLTTLLTNPPPSFPKFNSQLLTISGSSAGANLALASCNSPLLHGADTAVKAVITLYAPLDLRIPPTQKPRHGNFPKRDPLSFMMPLYDAYPSPSRPGSLTDARCNPILLPVDNLPKRVFCVIAEVDILVKENLDFISRVNDDLARREDGKEWRVEAWVVKDAFHGWLELPGFILRKAKIWDGKQTLEGARREVFERVAGLLREVHREGGWEWKPVGL